VQRWYYNEAVGTCLPFWYGGCDGNSNRFNSEKECLQICGVTSASWPNSPIDACFMKQDVGPCSDYVFSWHYDIQQNECIHFWFGGCGGNKNRFNTQEECEALFFSNYTFVKCMHFLIFKNVEKLLTTCFTSVI
uniref:BPTI/Kunitz inhibitor domain-containing protein n=1 Tax=Sinocyclocheilus grahami TaxID=75366 RepID=A0A672LA53_SINGR